MAEDLSMGGTNSSVPLNEASAMPKSSPFRESDNHTDVHTDGSGHSLNDSEPSTPVHETPFSQFTDKTQTNIYRPYAIEEPDDEADPVVQKRVLPCLPDYFERWQRELVDSMHDLGSRANKAVAVVAKLHQNQRRGQKRKSANANGAGNMHNSQPHRSESKTRIEEAPLHVPGLGPKRRRRRSKLPGDAAGNGRPVSLHDFRETHSDGSSSSEPHSTGASSTDTVNESAVADEMDID